MNILHASLDISHVNIKVQIPMWAQAWPWMDGMMKDTYYFKNMYVPAHSWWPIAGLPGWAPSGG